MRRRLWAFARYADDEPVSAEDRMKLRPRGPEALRRRSLREPGSDPIGMTAQTPVAAEPAPAASAPAAQIVPRPVFPLIDSLRGFAALSVVVYHVIELTSWTSFPIRGPLVWFRIGWMGVDLFIVISGFVIALSAFQEQCARPYRAYLAAFTSKRLRRIVPLYCLTGLLFVVCVVPAQIPAPGFAADALAHLAFIHNTNPATHGSIDGPNWSVGLEMQFYVLIGLLAPVLIRLRLWQLAAGGLASGLGWRLVTGWMAHRAGADAYHTFFITTQLPGCLDEFCAGVLMARLVLSPAGERALAWGRRHPWAPALGAAAAVWATLSVYWANASFWDSLSMIVLWRTTCATSCAAAVWAACCLSGPQMERALAPLQFAGRISYGIYLWHLLVIRPSRGVAWHSPWLFLCYVLVVTCVLAAGSWHFFEKPLLRSIRRG